MSEASPGILWTAMPLELVLNDPTATMGPTYRELSIEGRLLQVVPGSDGMGVIERLISCDPQDYLDPRWQPGQQIALNP